MTAKKVLIVELPGFKPIPSFSDSGFTDWSKSAYVVTSEQAALAVLNTPSNNIGAVLTNAPMGKIFSIAQTLTPHAQKILVTDQTFEQYQGIIGKEISELIDQIIANHEIAVFTLKELEAVLKFALNDEELTLKSFLKENTEIQSLKTTESKDRERLNDAVAQYAKKKLPRGYFSKIVYIICEELLMNAIYDAPFEAGKIDHIESDRTIPISLVPEDAAHLQFGYDGETFALSVTDPFGLLNKDKFFKYVGKIARRHLGGTLMDDKKRGAGLGIFMILHNSHGIHAHVIQGKKTEVIVLLHVPLPLKDLGHLSRSISYFSR